MTQTIRYNKILSFARQEAERLYNETVEAEHLLLAILRLGEGGAWDLLNRAGVDPIRAKQQLDDALQQDPPEMVNPIQRSIQVERILRIADGEALLYRAQAIGTEHLLLAILREHINRAAAYLEQEWQVDYARIESLYPHPETTPRDGGEMSEDIEDQPKHNSPKSDRRSTKSDSKTDTPAVDKYGRDLSKQAAEGRLDPVVGREVEIERVVQILSRR